MDVDRVESRLRRAWKALAESSSQGTGWQTIALSSENGEYFRAGILFTEKNESVLVHVDMDGMPKEVTLPSGKGFSLVNAGPLGERPGLWMALCRQPFGDLGMFVRMAADILNVCSGTSGKKAEQEFRIFVSRIAAWQNFMKRAGKQLSVPRQLGLCGELEILGDLLDAGVGPLSALSFWQGPSGGLHDFVLPSGALEVKSTVTQDKIWISSAEQLDTSVKSPLFLAVVNFSVDREQGTTLIEYMDSVREKIGDNFPAKQIYDSYLLELGILFEDNANKHEKFVLKSKYFFEITNDFPSLNKSNLPPEVCDIKYCLNIGNLLNISSSLTIILKKSGVC